MKADNELVDITLACENESVQAHKVILSACSPFFKRVLLKTKHPNPFIYIKGIHYQDLLAILDFIYKGETDLAEEDVNRFINAAKELEISGLAHFVEEGQDSIDDEAPPFNTNTEKVEEVRKNMKEEIVETTLSELDATQSTEELSAMKTKTVKLSIVNDDQGKKSLSKLDDEIAEKMERYQDEVGGVMWKCKICGKTTKQRNKLSWHVEIHLEGYIHNCEYCGKVFKTRNSLQGHVYTVHSNAKKDKIISNK